jgi:hypothetical protein
VIEFARKKGIIAIKLTTMKARGTVGWPDYLFLHAGKVMFIEFKAPGAKPTPRQEQQIQKLIKNGFYVRVIDDMLEGRRALATFFDVGENIWDRK